MAVRIGDLPPTVLVLAFTLQVRSGYGSPVWPARATHCVCVCVCGGGGQSVGDIRALERAYARVLDAASGAPLLGAAIAVRDALSVAGAIAAAAAAAAAAGVGGAMAAAGGVAPARGASVSAPAPPRRMSLVNFKWPSTRSGGAGAIPPGAAPPLSPPPRPLSQPLSPPPAAPPVAGAGAGGGDPAEKKELKRGLLACMLVRTDP